MDKTANSKQSNSIPNDQELLNLMMHATVSAPEEYVAGAYWQPMMKNSVRQLKSLGLNDFRSSKNTATTSFGDSPNLFALPNPISIKEKIKKTLVSIKPIKSVFERQVSLTLHQFEESTAALNSYYAINPRVSELMRRYPIEFDTTLGGCETFYSYEGRSISHLYLKLLDTLDYMNDELNLSQIKSFIEIGGGFGVNVDLKINFFPSIRKILYVDIAPNLYVGTQYLKAKYGSSVIDYRQSKDSKTIRFKNDDSLEIYCILPMQLERVEAEFDLFHNAHSFVEMPRKSVVNYARLIKNLLKENGRTYLVTYDGFDNSTINPADLVELISIPLKMSKKPTLNKGRFDFHFS